ncbi:hypothetical protein H3018_gp02 [Bacillus phage DK3]|uniref:Uncharacterized protein n=2 Tax=Hemphillvirus TaxID=2842725 RepID=A0A3T0IJ23_9CAUD|nr:hypothetical protein H3016_gp02 [Bacillus phage DK1]YP_009910492.1 hypothetical protein H3018_gp02 [Bacillus phage DK3]AZU99706.1 hypothetical protein DK1_00002 [Bacillus phage DK1]AZU99800.1 hypothetical protein DK3_00002 [Bacillus phage DK3]
MVSVNDISDPMWYDRFEFYDMTHLINRVEKYYNRELIFLQKHGENYIIIIDKKK